MSEVVYVPQLRGKGNTVARVEADGTRRMVAQPWRDFNPLYRFATAAEAWRAIDEDHGLRTHIPADHPIEYRVLRCEATEVQRSG